VIETGVGNVRVLLTLTVILLLTAYTAIGTTTITQHASLVAISTSKPTKYALNTQPATLNRLLMKVKADSVIETPIISEIPDAEVEKSRNASSIKSYMEKYDLPSKTASHYANFIMGASDKYKVDPFLVVALIKVETSEQPFRYDDSPNDDGAIGLTQILNVNASWMGVGVSELYDPETNIYLGVKYLKTLQDRFGYDLGITAYNQGEGNVQRGTYNTKYFKAIQKVYMSIEGNPLHNSDS
jgi:soluble lytic murein transglycosylase-like protein